METKKELDKEANRLSQEAKQHLADSVAWKERCDKLTADMATMQKAAKEREQKMLALQKASDHILDKFPF